MPTSFSHAQIEQFKLQAKFSSRASGIAHSNALDEIANSHGFSNWSLLMKNAVPAATLQHARKYFRFSRTSDEMRQGLLKVQRTLGPFSSRTEEAERQTANIWEEFGSAMNAVEFAVDYMTCLLTVPRFKISSDATVYWEMRGWLPYEVGELGISTQILLNRRYKPVGKGGRDWVDYDDFKHLHTQLDADQMAAIAHRAGSDGYLYNDGCTPWSSRRDAQAYLVRLRRLQAFLHGQKIASSKASKSG